MSSPASAYGTWTEHQFSASNLSYKLVDGAGYIQGWLFPVLEGWTWHVVGFANGSSFSLAGAAAAAEAVFARNRFPKKVS